VVALIALYLAGIVLVALSIEAFARRDVGGPLLRLGTQTARATYRPSPGRSSTG
jgi:hypothetical protein